MNIIKKVIVFAGLLAASINASSHIYLDADGATPPRNQSGTSCGTPGDSPTVFKSGAIINVSFLVAIVHGDEVVIDFSAANDENFDDYVLKTVKAVAGQASYYIGLPNIECEHCTLRVANSGYTTCADIQLTATGMPLEPTQDTTAPLESSLFNGSASDKQVMLTWVNPIEDFYKAIIFQSDQAVTFMPQNGNTYDASGEWDGAKVVYSGSAESAALNQLMAGTKYYFRIFNVDASLNYSLGVDFQITTTNTGNAEPVITLTVMQNDIIGTQVNKEDGEVFIQAAVVDADQQDSHTLDWSATDNRLVDIHADDAMFSFDPSELAIGEYSVVLTVSDDGSPQLSTTQSLTIGVQSKPVSSSSAVSVQNNSQNTSSGGSFGWLFICALGLFGSLCRFSIRHK